MSSLKPSRPTLPTALVLLSVVTLSFFFLTPHIAHLRTSDPVQGTAKCVLYDRPPRTGSTTISLALANCMLQKNYTVTAAIHDERTGTVRRMLSSPSDRLAAVKGHIGMSEEDIKLVKQRCGQMLYITSCAPMQKRLYSAAKYALADGHGNSTLEGDRLELIKRQLTYRPWVEPFLEAYPHVTEDKKPLDHVLKRIVPDYVIRWNSVGEDLEKLLETLGCSSTFQSRNVHATSFDEEKVISGINVRMGDRMYGWLMDVAKGNEKGLDKARQF